MGEYYKAIFPKTTKLEDSEKVIFGRLQIIVNMVSSERFNLET